jgi:hypothetical protein
MKLTNSFSGRGGCMRAQRKESLVCITTEISFPLQNVFTSHFMQSGKIKAFKKTFQRGGDGKQFSADRFFWNAV